MCASPSGEQFAACSFCIRFGPSVSVSVAANNQVHVPINDKPRIAYVDDAITFTLSWKGKLKEHFDVVTYSSTTQFLQKVEEEKGFLQSLDLIVTDYHFSADDPLNGKTFAAELRKMGFEKPIYLASNGDFAEEEIRPNLTGAIGKEIPTSDMVMSWINRRQI